MTKSPLAVSAPGKVLFTGGFLVLDRKHTGLVLGLDARIHVRIEDWEDHDVKSAADASTNVLVQSPQFQDAKWLYSVSTSSSASVSVAQVTDDSRFTTSGNKFVATTLLYVLTYIVSKEHTSLRPIKMTVMADDSYYSQTDKSSQGPEGFANFGCKISEAHKTGLGSSAALVTSLTSALVMWYLPVTSAEPPRHLIHNLAQAAHCAAQGKVGSGFDVAAAVFGSCLYRRFSPSILEKIGEPSSEGFTDRLGRCIDDTDEQKWDVEVSSEAVQIPHNLLLLMCDVDCGSETPGMVRKVLAWRKDKPAEAHLLWEAIQKGSNELCQVLTRLSQTENTDQDQTQELSDIIATIRGLVREMSALSEVPVEPGVITELLDSCTALPGVVGGVAPGAGGYDAVALLVQNDPQVIKELEGHLQGWKARERGTGITIGKVQLLKARQAYEGARVEKAERYAAWV